MDKAYYGVAGVSLATYWQRRANNACTRHVGVCALSRSFRGLKLVPAKRRYLVPPTSTPRKHAGHNAHRWALAR
jgi:hypothetical protein